MMTLYRLSTISNKETMEALLAIASVNPIFELLKFRNPEAKEQVTRVVGVAEARTVAQRYGWNPWASPGRRCGRFYLHLMANQGHHDGVQSLERSFLHWRQMPISLDMFDRAVDYLGEERGTGFMVMRSSSVRDFLRICRDSPSVTPMGEYRLPSGLMVLSYEGIPIFRNDFIPMAKPAVYVGSFGSLHGLLESIKCTTVDGVETIVWGCGLARRVGGKSLAIHLEGQDLADVVREVQETERQGTLKPWEALLSLQAIGKQQGILSERRVDPESTRCNCGGPEGHVPNGILCRRL